MTKLIVTVLDTTGIQSYIFGSNRLRENIGASYLVSEATTTWVREALKQLSPKFNQKIHAFEPKEHKPDTKPYIEDGKLAAELIYAGGGNTVLLFSEWEYARNFTEILSKRVLENAPGINLVVAHYKDFEWDTQSLYEVVQDLIKNNLEANKNSFVPSAPLLGLGVTATCKSTQLVAVEKSEKYEDEDPYLISREIQKKLEAAKEKANQKLKQDLLDSFTREIYEFPLRTDFLGRSQEESSYAAIVHADGNGIGERFQNCGKGKGNREYIIELRRLSYSVHQAGINSLKEIIDILIDSMGELKDKLDLKNDRQLPFRPLVYGGDDTTFVCEGRLGLKLAALYLEALQAQPITYGGSLKACAGISIVKTHYPFARAYELSEQLCREAKRYVKDKNEGDFSALDWHIASSGLTGSIQDIREREYRVKIPDYQKIAHLEMRPVRLEHNSSDWRSWQGFETVVRELKEGSYWSQRRNKVIQLREVIRKGINATDEFLKAYRLDRLPEFPNSNGKEKILATNGWIDGICGYFDAIEAMEFYTLGEETNESLLSQDKTAK